MPTQLVTISEIVDPLNRVAGTIWVFKYKGRNTYPEKDWRVTVALEKESEINNENFFCIFNI